MHEADAQAVLLARSFEEADVQHLLLSARDRHAATEAARASGGAVERQAVDRAERLLVELEERAPALQAVRRLTRLSPRMLLPAALLAFALGAASNALGPDRQINVLSFPLLGLIAWNLAIYAMLLTSGAVRLALRVSRRRKRVEDARSVATEGGAAAWRGLPGAVATWIARRSLRRVESLDATCAAIATRALGTYWRRWSRLIAPLVAARLELGLHLGAIGLAVGAVLGMYVRGLTFEYRATWESTFLGPDAAALLLHVVLGPAAVLLGVAVPDAAALAAMRAPLGSDTAAIWIHLWATTAAIVIVVPRLVLAASAFARQRRLARHLEVDPTGGSFRELLAPDRGAGLTVEVFPYSYRIAGREVDTLLELLHEVFGLRADVRVMPVLPYGSDLPRSSSDGANAIAVLIYGLVQSPEREVHGRLASELATRFRAPSQVLALVDSSAWRARFADGDERRAEERRRAWDRVLAETGVAPLHVDLGAPIAEDLVQAAEARLKRSADAARERSEPR